jgi:hypothetical protein
MISRTLLFSVTALVIAMTNAHAVSKVPAEMVGNWCFFDKYDGQTQQYLACEIQNNSDTHLVIDAYGYSGHEYGCVNLAVKTWIDRNLPLNTKEMGAPIMRVEL